MMGNSIHQNCQVMIIVPKLKRFVFDCVVTFHRAIFCPIENLDSACTQSGYIKNRIVDKIKATSVLLQRATLYPYLTDYPVIVFPRNDFVYREHNLSFQFKVSLLNSPKVMEQRFCFQKQRILGFCCYTWKPLSYVCLSVTSFVTGMLLHVTPSYYHPSRYHSLPLYNPICQLGYQNSDKIRLCLNIYMYLYVAVYI